MARRSKRKSTPDSSESSVMGSDNSTVLGDSGGETTGRMIVTFRDDASGAAEKTLESCGLSHIAHAVDFSETAGLEALEDESTSLVLDELGIAVLPAGADAAALSATLGDESSAILGVEPEYICYTAEIQSDQDAAPTASMLPAAAAAFVRGYASGVAEFARALTGDAAVPPTSDEAEVLAAFVDTAAFTWGLIATKTNVSRCTGRGIRVCVLDTGMDLAHPDFRGRRITSRSFVPGQPVQDGHSHGTHCVGTAMGPSSPPRPPGTRRYGCAPGAEIFVGKVLNNAGSGPTGQVLAGMNWAIASKCHIISMSLGYFLPASAPESIAFDTAARRGLTAGTLSIAASGNERASGRQMRSPAICSNVMAVGAVDHRLAPATFSTPGDVDIAGPGVQTWSSVPMPGRYGSKSGTSMATPHVAGIAALWAESNAAFRGRALWQVLTSRARRLPFPNRDVGAGLVQAP